MRIVTNKGEFASFKDVRTFMQQEGLELIEITLVDYWGIKIARAQGFYTLAQINFVLSDPDKEFMHG